MRPLLLASCLLLAGCPRSDILAGLEGEPTELAGTDADTAFLAQLRDKLRSADPDDARDIARELAEFEIERARGRSGLAYVRGLGPCAALLEDALRSRAEQSDEIAAESILVLADADLVPAMSFYESVTNEQPWWRAVAARTLTVPEPDSEAAAEPADEDSRRLAVAGQWRRRFMRDPFRTVRGAALRAARAARDPKDAGALLEAARLDPDPEIRALAIGAAGALGGREVVLALKDVWEAGDESDRIHLVEAWAAPSSATSGGRHQILRVIQRTTGRPAVTAAARLLDGHEPAGAAADVATAAGTLARHIEEAPTEVRVAAIEAAALAWPELSKAVDEAARSTDEAVAVAALARQVEADEGRRAAQDRLLELAGRAGKVGDAAKQALARAGDPKLVPLLERDARARSAVERTNAAMRFVLLGQMRQALMLLGDPSARVRSRVACAILRHEE